MSSQLHMSGHEAKRGYSVLENGLQAAGYVHAPLMTIDCHQ